MLKNLISIISKKVFYNFYSLDREKNLEENNNMNEAQNCGLCGHYDPDYDEDALQMHWFRECPMVC